LPAEVAREYQDRRPRSSTGDALVDAFRRIYLSVHSPQGDELPPAIGITSARRVEGRTTMAIGIASAMAIDLGVPVVLIEVDLMNPGLHRLLGIPAEPGVAEYLRGECDIGAAVRRISDDLFVLPAGNAHHDAARLIRRLTTADLHQRLDSSGAALVFDLPPVLDSSFGVLASSMAETLIFVARSGRSTIPQTKEALSRLEIERVHSIVLNDASPLFPRWLRRH
jgi:Mrp family chromosome partitioning ATPase